MAWLRSFDSDITQTGVVRGLVAMLPVAITWSKVPGAKRRS